MENQKYMQINGIQVPINGEKNVLEVIRKANIELPTFCYHSELSIYGACRLCVSEIDNMGIQTTCSIVPKEGMVVRTNTKEVRQIRKVNLELILANHEISCPSCSRSNNCKLQDLSRRIGVTESRFKKTDKKHPIDKKSDSIVHNPNKCVLCGDCVRVCKEIQTVGAIDFVNRGANTMVAPAFHKSLADVECINCGQCVSVCPVGALTVKSETDKVWDAIHDKSKTVVVQVAPAVRVAIGEEFGFEAGTATTGKMVAALKHMGFDSVYDTSFSADMTILEEVTELVHRKQNGGVLPLISSCCPSWVKFAEQYYPELLPHLSTCKSPQQMFGSVAKKVLPKLLGIKKEDLVMVSLMPCTAKKFEAKRKEFEINDQPDVDHVVTTTEAALMISEAGILFNHLTPESFDLPMGFKTGGGIIFGNSGGVTEAALRYAYEKLTGETLLNNDFKMVRGEDGCRSASVNIGEGNLNVGVVHSLKNARTICENIKNGKAAFDFIEVMACPGGCIDGGGQPVSFDPDFKKKRTESIFKCDKQLQLHKPQDNPYVNEIYEDQLGEIGGHQAHELLHTQYTSRKRITNQTFLIRDTAEPKIEVCVCVGTNCYLKGSQDLLKQLMDYVSQNKLEDLVGFEGQQEMVDVKATFCFERCDRGPVVRINHIVIEKANFEKAKIALDKEINRVGSLILVK